MNVCSKDAVRVLVKKVEPNVPPEVLRFSVDPQITNLTDIRMIISKAFDLKPEFMICCQINATFGNANDSYALLLSDIDLHKAFTRAQALGTYASDEPSLVLLVESKPFEERSSDWKLSHQLPLLHQMRTNNCQEAMASGNRTAPSTPIPPRAFPSLFSVGRSLNMVVQRAFNMTYEENDRTTSLSSGNTNSNSRTTEPLTEIEFRNDYLDPVGQLCNPERLRSTIYCRGIEPSLRKVVWKHLLNVYPSGMTGRARMDYIKRKAVEYESLKRTWLDAIRLKHTSKELAYTTGMVRKDVLRTDRHHPYFAGSDDNEHINALFNILTTYALNHPSVGYCQGMSDLASPLLVAMNDESHAYICFCALMQRVGKNFMIDGIAMTEKFEHLANALQFYDIEFYNYLKSQRADDLLFCYRWLLLEMKREFCFEDSMRMLEVLWSSLPAEPVLSGELRLFGKKFQSSTSIYPDVAEYQLDFHGADNSIRSWDVLKIHQLITPPMPNGNIRDGEDREEQTTVLSSYKSPATNIKLSNGGKCALPKSHSDNIANCNNYAPRTPGNTSRYDSANYNQLGSNYSVNSTTGGHFRELKERIHRARLYTATSLDRLNDASLYDHTKLHIASEKMVKNFNEFLNFNRNRTDGTHSQVYLWENPLHCNSSQHLQSDTSGGVNDLNRQQRPSLPPPNDFGGGNPFLMFLCVTMLLQHKSIIMTMAMDYNEMAMHFDKMVRQHDVNKVLMQARHMYEMYLKQHAEQASTLQRPYPPPRPPKNIVAHHRTDTNSFT